MGIPKSYSFKCEMTESGVVKCHANNFEINYEIVNRSAMMFALRKLLNLSDFSEKEIANLFRKACRLTIEIAGKITVLTNDKFVAFAAAISGSIGTMNNLIENLGKKIKKMLGNRFQNSRKR